MGGHTIDEVKLGNSFPRNPLMANFCAKTMPYRGLGSGIPRVLSEDSDVQFVDDKAGNQFKAIVKRPAVESQQVAQEVGPVSDQVSDQVVTKYSLSRDQVLSLFELLAEPSSATQMRELFGRRNATYFRRNTIQPMLDEGVIAPLDTQSAHSPQQKYYLTEKGKALYKQLK